MRSYGASVSPVMFRMCGNDPSCSPPFVSANRTFKKGANISPILAARLVYQALAATIRWRTARNETIKVAKKLIETTWIRFLKSISSCLITKNTTARIIIMVSIYRKPTATIEFQPAEPI